VPRGSSGSRRGASTHLSIPQRGAAKAQQRAQMGPPQRASAHSAYQATRPAAPIVQQPSLELPVQPCQPAPQLGNGAHEAAAISLSVARARPAAAEASSRPGPAYSREERPHGRLSGAQELCLHGRRLAQLAERVFYVCVKQRSGRSWREGWRGAYLLNIIPYFFIIEPWLPQ